MKRIIYILTLILTASCNGKGWNLDESADPMIVVEGWIENGKPATVILTQLLPFAGGTGTQQDFNLESLPLRWATVKLSDGEREEVLVGMYNENYVPPYVYAGSSIKGEPGKTYTLSVKYPGVEVVAESTMPEEPVRIERTEVFENTADHGQYSIRIHFEDNPQTKDYYMVFTKIKGNDTRFYPSFMNTVEDSVFPSGNGNVVVNRAFRHVDALKEYTPYFFKTDTVQVKLARLPEEGFEFWDGYGNEITNSANILFPSTSNLKTNIHGGRGIWCAYAVDIEEVEY